MQTNTKDPFQKYLSFATKALGPKDYKIFALAGDASSRRYFRVVSENDSWVLMDWDPFVDDGKYPFLNVLEHFAKHQVHVPLVIAKSPQDGLVLLEDLGDLTLERKFWENQNQELVLPNYKLAIDELIKIHYGATSDQSTNCVAFSVAFDTDKLLWEMNYGKEHLLLKLCDLKMSQQTINGIDKLFLNICETLNKEPKFIAHRDYHSRNVMIKLGKMRVIDFQDARMGAIQYDLVSLLRDSYVDMDASTENQLIQYYLEERMNYSTKNKLPKISRDEFNYIYEVQTIQRCFKACGSFSSFYNMRQDTRYLKYIHNTLMRVAASLEKFSEYKLFHDVLSDNGLFEHKFV